MANNDVAVRFNKVSFAYGHNKPILDEASFALRRGSKMTLMGQNGAGKSTMLELITGALKADDGTIYVDSGLKIAYAKQVISREFMALTMREFFAKYFSGKNYDINRKIDEVLGVVNLKALKDKVIKTFSGGQQARLLLASALIQDPDLLILDEPTNHINFRHLPVIAKALDSFKGAMILVSHVLEFVE